MNPYAPPASFDTSPSGDGNGRIDVGIDIGSSKICVAVGERKRNGSLNILGVAMVPSRGVEKGSIVDMALAGECLHAALEAAEDKAEVVIKKIYLAVAGVSIFSSNHSVGIDLPEKRKSVTERDRKEIAERSREMIIPDQNVFLHRLLQTYRIDGGANVTNPVGLQGRRLEADFHIVQGAETALRNLIKCASQQGLDVEDVVFGPLAAGCALLNEDQKRQGVLLIDLGAGTTDYVLYRDGVVHQSGVLAIGGNQISRDISICCDIPFAEAERLKMESGMVERQKLDEIIHARMRETLEILKRKLDAELRLNNLGAGIIQTGGGSLLAGVGQLTEEIFGMAVTLNGNPAIYGFEEEYQNPRYASALGLLRWIQR